MTAYRSGCVSIDEIVAANSSPKRSPRPLLCRSYQSRAKRMSLRASERMRTRYFIVSGRARPERLPTTDLLPDHDRRRRAPRREHVDGSPATESREDRCCPKASRSDADVHQPGDRRSRLLSAFSPFDSRSRLGNSDSAVVLTALDRASYLRYLPRPPQLSGAFV